MNCDRANQIDLVDYLHVLGFNPHKIFKENWYLSPLRKENHASFKVNKNKNVWYNHGLGKGGNLIDFAMEFYRSSLSEALIRFLFFTSRTCNKISFKDSQFTCMKTIIKDKDARELSIQIIAAKQPIQNLMLCRYLKQRRIEKHC